MSLTRVARGQNLDLRASTHNAFIDAANDYNQRRSKLQNKPAALALFPFATVIKVKNISGSACDALNILELTIDGSVIDVDFTAPDDTPNTPWELTKTNINTYKFGQTILDGDTPSDGDPRSPVVVLLQPAAIDQIVDAVIQGVVTCYVDIEDANHRYATIQASRSNLKSSQCGQFRILDREDDGATGNTQYCKVALDYSSPLRAKAEIDNNASAITANGSGLVTFVNGTTKETTDKVTAHYNWMTGGAASLADGTEVLIEYFPAESKWIIVAADCQ